jgi:hypothetical protein
MLVIKYTKLNRGFHKVSQLLFKDKQLHKIILESENKSKSRRKGELKHYIFKKKKNHKTITPLVGKVIGRIP